MSDPPVSSTSASSTRASSNRASGQESLARAAQARLAHTVNIAPDFGTPLEQNWTFDLQRCHLKACARHGFTAIRLLTYLTAHRTPAGLDTRILRRVEQIVDDATSLGLGVVIANHRDPELIADPDSQLPATLAAVTELAGVFAGRGAELVLEPLAEPEQALDPIWNTVAAELIGAVRGQDQHRTILLGPRTMSNARPPAMPTWPAGPAGPGSTAGWPRSAACPGPCGHSRRSSRSTT